LAEAKGELGYIYTKYIGFMTDKLVRFSKGRDEKKGDIEYDIIVINRAYITHFYQAASRGKGSFVFISGQEKAIWVEETIEQIEDILEPKVQLGDC
jgi:hypothetical protein